MTQQDGSLRAVLQLDKKSGRFEYDARGYQRFIPDKDWLAQKEREIGDALDAAARDLAPRFNAAAESIETYRPARTSMPDSGDRALLPSPAARTPADQIIANTVNNILRPRPVTSVDAYFKASYPVLTPQTVESLRTQGIPIDPMAPPEQTVAVPLMVDSEELARIFQAALEFINRERRDSFWLWYEAIYGCVVPGWCYWKVCYKDGAKTTIGPKLAKPFIDLSDETEEYRRDSRMHEYIIQYNNVLRPNIDQKLNDLDWFAERASKKPDEVTEAYENDSYFLIPDDAAAKTYAAQVGVVVDDTRQRTDTSTKDYTPSTPRTECDIWEIWFKAYLKVVDPEDPKKSTTRRFSLMGDYHRGARKFLCIYRNPYNHQRLPYVLLQQNLDGASTVDLVKYNQQMETFGAQAMVKSSHIATTPLYWYKHDVPEVREYFTAIGDKPLVMGTAIPGEFGKDWGVAQNGFTHVDMMKFLDWNSQKAERTSRMGEYGTGGQVVSHTSPYTVQQMLDRGGQPSLLFLRMLDRANRDVVKLYLETARQYEPLGEILPIRDPKSRKYVEVPFHYPVGDILDNFNITLTAANDAIAKERDPDQQAMYLATFQQHADFMNKGMAAIAGTVADPNLPPEMKTPLIEYYRKVMEAEQKMYQQMIGPIRTDEDTFDFVSVADRLIAQREQLAAQAAEAQAQQQAMAAQQGQMAEQGGMMMEQPMGGSPQEMPMDQNMGGANADTTLPM